MYAAWDTALIKEEFCKSMIISSIRIIECGRQHSKYAVPVLMEAVLCKPPGHHTECSQLGELVLASALLRRALGHVVVSLALVSDCLYMLLNTGIISILDITFCQRNNWTKARAGKKTGIHTIGHSVVIKYADTSLA